MAPALHCRRAGEEDLAALTHVAMKAKQHWGYPQSWIDLWRDELEYTVETLAEQEVHCAVANGAIVGVVAVSVEGRLAELEGLWVLPSHFGQGIGRALMQIALMSAAELGAHRLRIAADPHAEAFYAHLGAKRHGQVASRPGDRQLPVLEMAVPAAPR